MPLDKYDLVAINYINDYKDLAKEIYKAGLKRGYEKGILKNKTSIQLNTVNTNTNNDDYIKRQDAINALGEEPEVWTENDEYAQGLNNQWHYDVNALKAVPPAQSETYKEKLNEIASALSEKFAYMNTCLNERDIILGYLGVKRCCETHCNTDCTNTKCESHPLSSAQPEPCEDTLGVNLHVVKISKHCSDFSDLDNVKECEDAVSRQAAIDIFDDYNVSVENGDLEAYSRDRKRLCELPSTQPERTCVNCGRTANNGGWYADGRTRCPIEEHYALPKDGYCHLWEKRNVTDDDYPERTEE